MCGIFGLIDRRGADAAVDEKILCEMGRRIGHRGPDDHGEWCDRAHGVMLGHRRLSIIDLSPAGQQPMTSACGRYVIVLNGEIYNFLDIRRGLESMGHGFRGRSDTEVALAAVSEYGVEKALRKFVGMFAFALWDQQEGELWLARDRAGEKPLYYGTFSGIFGFASDLDALRAHPHWQAEIDRNALGLLVQHVYVPAPRSIYKNFKKLPAGMTVRVGTRADVNCSEPFPYWSVYDFALAQGHRAASVEPQHAVEELDTLLRQTISNKMISDVPLGAFLSGGIDSSTVVALMQSQSSTPVKTFSIGFNEEDFNEAKEAKRVAAHLGTEHTELYVSPEAAREVIPKLPALYSEPFADSSQIPTFLVSELARRSVTVALSGDGGDELFGGYNRYAYAGSAWQSQQRWPLGLRRALAAVAGQLSPDAVDRVALALRPMLPPSLRYKQFGNRVHKFASVLGVDDPVTVYRLLISMWQRQSQVVIGSGEPDMLRELEPGLSALSSFPEQMMLADFLTYLPDDILTKVDRASMGVSLEVRIPFLDHRIIEYAWKTPLSLKIVDGKTKWLLRQVLYRYIPKEMVERPKMGFAVPVGKWLRGPLRRWGNDLLDEQRLNDDGYLKTAEVRRKWEEHVDGKADWTALLWPLLMFQAWHEHYH